MSHRRSNLNVADELSDEILLLIFKYLDRVTILSISHVCKSWNRVHYDDSLWDSLYSLHFHETLPQVVLNCLTATRTYSVSNSSTHSKQMKNMDRKYKASHGIYFAYQLFKERYQQGKRYKKRISNLIEMESQTKLDSPYHFQREIYHALCQYFPFLADGEHLKILSSQNNATYHNVVDLVEVLLWILSTKQDRQWIMERDTPLAFQNLYA